VQLLMVLAMLAAFRSLAMLPATRMCCLSQSEDLRGPLQLVIHMLPSVVLLLGSSFHLPRAGQFIEGAEIIDCRADSS
jgi:hypothetical protein